MINIGIVITDPRSERKKQELVVYSKKRPWCKNIKLKYMVNRKGVLSIPGDIAIGYYIMYKYKNVKVDFIRPSEISVRRFHSNDLVFIIIYDLLESFHTDRINFENFKRTLKNCRNVYPDYRYQKMINNKCSYYKFLEKEKINVVPTFCVSSETSSKEGLQKVVNKLFEKVKYNGWKKFIAKPVYGQESSDFRKFTPNNTVSVKKYLTNAFKKYPGIIFQEYIEGFDKENPEYRMYFVGNKYVYTIITTATVVDRPKAERGNFKENNLKRYKTFSRKVLKKLPDVIVDGVKLPRLLTRIDVSCCLEGPKSIFVNELEFVPSLYIEENTPGKPIDQLLGDKIVSITKIFKKKL